LSAVGWLEIPGSPCRTQSGCSCSWDFNHCPGSVNSFQKKITQRLIIEKFTITNHNIQWFCVNNKVQNKNHIFQKYEKSSARASASRSWRSHNVYPSEITGFSPYCITYKMASAFGKTSTPQSVSSWIFSSPRDV